MRWNIDKADWPDMVDRISDTLRGVEAGYLEETGPNREAVIAHIAERHDLTRAEAEATLFERILLPREMPLAYAAE